MNVAPVNFVLIVVLSVGLVGCTDKQEPKSVSTKEQVLMGAIGVGGGCGHVRTLQEVRENRPCQKDGK